MFICKSKVAHFIHHRVDYPVWRGDRMMGDAGPLDSFPEWLSGLESLQAANAVIAEPA